MLSSLFLMGLGVWALRDRLKQGISGEVAEVTSKTLEHEAVILKVEHSTPENTSTVIFDWAGRASFQGHRAGRAK